MQQTKGSRNPSTNIIIKQQIQLKQTASNYRLQPNHQNKQTQPNQDPIQHSNNIKINKQAIRNTNQAKIQTKSKLKEETLKYNRQSATIVNPTIKIQQTTSKQ